MSVTKVEKVSEAEGIVEKLDKLGVVGAVVGLSPIPLA
jgi:hypothetical protein